MEPRRPSAVILADDSHAIPQATQKMEVASQETRSLARKRLKKKLSGDLDTIILKALRKEPQKRYLSVEQFASDVRRYLEGRPVIARIDTPGYRFRKFVGRNIAGVVTAVALIAILTGTAIFFGLRDKANHQRAEEAAVALERQLLHADLEIGTADRVQSAYNLASAIGRAHPEAIDSRRDLAQAAFKMGEIAPDRNTAAKYYGESIAQLDSLSQQSAHRDPDVERALGAASAKIGRIEMERGNLLAALSSFSRALQIAETLSASEGASASPETRLAVADTNAQVGEVLMRNGARAEGAAKLKKAMGIYRESGQMDRAAEIEQQLRER